MNSYKFFCLFFDHSSNNMLKWFEVFPMHTYEKRAFWCLERNIEFFPWEIDRKSFQSNT
jgi:hypothetical protein